MRVTSLRPFLRSTNILCTPAHNVKFTKVSSFGSHNIFNGTSFARSSFHSLAFNSRSRFYGSLFGAAVAVTTLGVAMNKVFADASTEDEEIIKKAGEYKEGLPEYTRSEVAKHSTKENRIWVTYKNGVYDITDFIEMHP